MLAERHRLPVAIGGDVADGEQGHCKAVAALRCAMVMQCANRPATQCKIRAHLSAGSAAGAPKRGAGMAIPPRPAVCQRNVPNLSCGLLGAAERPAADAAGAHGARNLVAVHLSGKFQRQRHRALDGGLEGDVVAVRPCPRRCRWRALLAGQLAGERSRPRSVRARVDLRSPIGVCIDSFQVPSADMASTPLLQGACLTRKVWRDRPVPWRQFARISRRPGEKAVPADACRREPDAMIAAARSIRSGTGPIRSWKGWLMVGFSYGELREEYADLWGAMKIPAGTACCHGCAHVGRSPGASRATTRSPMRPACPGT